MSDQNENKDPLSDLIEDVDTDEIVENEKEIGKNESLEDVHEVAKKKAMKKESDDEEMDDDEEEMDDDEKEESKKPAKEAKKVKEAKAVKKESDEEEMDDEEDDDMEDEKEESKKAKKEETETDDEVIEEEVIEIPEALTDLLNAEDALTEDFIEQTAELFRSELQEQVEKRADELEAKYNQIMEEQLEKSVGDLVEKVDGYLNYVVENWIKENEVAIEKGLRTEIAENFIESLKNVFTENYIEVPAEKEDLVSGLEENVTKLESKLAEQTKSAITLTEEVTKLKRERILTEASKDLALTESEKLVSLTEDLDFDDEETFANKVESMKESYFRNGKEVKEVKDTMLNEDNLDTEEEETSPWMDSIVSSLSRQVKRKK